MSAGTSASRAGAESSKKPKHVFHDALEQAEGFPHWVLNGARKFEGFIDADGTLNLHPTRAKLSLGKLSKKAKYKWRRNMVLLMKAMRQAAMVKRTRHWKWLPDGTRLYFESTYEVLPPPWHPERITGRDEAAPNLAQWNEHEEPEKDGERFELPPNVPRARRERHKRSASGPRAHAGRPPARTPAPTRRGHLQDEPDEEREHKALPETELGAAVLSILAALEELQPIANRPFAEILAVIARRGKKTRAMIEAALMDVAADSLGEDWTVRYLKARAKVYVRRQLPVKSPTEPEKKDAKPEPPTELACKTAGTRTISEHERQRLEEIFTQPLKPGQPRGPPPKDEPTT